jgi:HK97 family phage prohead protease
VIPKNKLLTRAIKADLNTNTEGVFDGYIAVWNTVDAYKSTFVRGAFLDTIKKRGDRVKIIDDHSVLVGKSLSIIEDDYGVKVSGKININTTRGMDVFKLMQDKTYDGLSFGFSTPPGAVEVRNGIEYIKEVQLFEYGPVIFPANDNAVITDTRSTDYLENLEDTIEQGLGWVMLDTLQETICDIRWGHGEIINTVSILEQLDTAISNFHGAFMVWAKDHYLDSVPPGQDIFTFLASIGDDETIVSTTALTRADLKALRKGIPIENFKLDGLPAVQVENRRIRSNQIEQVCQHLKSGLVPAEKNRIRALLGTQEPPIDLVGQIKSFRDSLKQE